MYLRFKNKPGLACTEVKNIECFQIYLIIGLIIYQLFVKYDSGYLDFKVIHSYSIQLKATSVLKGGALQKGSVIGTYK